MHSTKILTLAVMLLLVACSAPESQNAVEHATSAPKPQSAQTPAMDSKSPPSVSVVAALERVVRKGMAYADFRNEAMAQGWTPVVDPECRTNVAGADHASVCPAHPELMACRACDEIPELSAYSGDARSLSVFRNDAQGLRMEVTGLGELKDWSVPGEESGLQIMGWEITPEKATR